MASTHILATGKIVRGEIDWDIAPLPVEEPQDGDLQRMIDEGEATAEYADWLEDIEWMRRGS